MEKQATVEMTRKANRLTTGPKNSLEACEEEDEGVRPLREALREGNGDEGRGEVPKMD